MKWKWLTPLLNTSAGCTQCWVCSQAQDPRSLVWHLSWALHCTAQTEPRLFIISEMIKFITSIITSQSGVMRLCLNKVKVCPGPPQCNPHKTFHSLLFVWIEWDATKCLSHIWYFEIYCNIKVVWRALKITVIAGLAQTSRQVKSHKAATQGPLACIFLHFLSVNGR